MALMGMTHSLERELIAEGIAVLKKNPCPVELDWDADTVVVELCEHALFKTDICGLTTYPVLESHIADYLSSETPIRNMKRRGIIRIKG